MTTSFSREQRCVWNVSVIGFNIMIWYLHILGNNYKNKFNIYQYTEVHFFFLVMRIFLRPFLANFKYTILLIYLFLYLFILFTYFAWPPGYLALVITTSLFSVFMTLFLFSCFCLSEVLFQDHVMLSLYQHFTVSGDILIQSKGFTTRKVKKMEYNWLLFQPITTEWNYK